MPATSTHTQSPKYSGARPAFGRRSSSIGTSLCVAKPLLHGDHCLFVLIGLCNGWGWGLGCLIAPGNQRDAVPLRIPRAAWCVGHNYIPERPGVLRKFSTQLSYILCITGALRKFLDSLGDDWNVSLFHYRNHGADVGRVLVGLQVPPDERPHFKDFLATLGYVWQDEGDNLVYQNFLK